MTKQTKDLVWMIVSLAAGFAVSRLTPTPPLTQEGLAVLGVFLSLIGRASLPCFFWACCLILDFPLFFGAPLEM